MSTTDPYGQVPDSLPLPRTSLAWHVNAEPAVLGGGGRALLMQVAHPGVGAGVEQHSTYASDPWGRFFRTMDVMMKLSFGTPEASARQVRLLEKMHRRVVGTTDDGAAYSARDTALQLWVWATLVDTALLVFELVRTPLTPDQKDRYYAESKLTAYGCGVPRGSCPETWSDFQAYVAHVVAHDLRVTDSARAVAHASMVPPLPAPVGQLASRPHRLMTVGLLPPSLRRGYGFDWDASEERELRRLLSVARLGARVTPVAVRELNARMLLNRKGPVRVPWLQRRGAELTAIRMDSFEPVAS
jgi:uncharacterized protein (DUF2236 family)